MNTTELMACEDCVMLIANGDLPDERPELDREISEYLGLTPSHHLAGGDAQCFEEFAYAPCECCGSRLGGSRSQVVLLCAAGQPV